MSRYRANDPARNGIEIGGKEGQSVRAAAAGEVVYSGSGRIGYGELIIVKHSERYLSAYAHNRKRLVKEGQRVKAGERIAEMGRNDRNKAILHFEIRLNGSPRDRNVCSMYMGSCEPTSKRSFGLASTSGLARSRSLKQAESFLMTTF